MANNKNMINKLPQVFQTVTQRKFFSATFDQLFSKKDSKKYNGYIGQRISGRYDPINDFYLPEQNRDRTWYQLEPVALTSNPNTLEKTNQNFYVDMVNNIRSLGGITKNHDRLFRSEYYSYSPPIDADKFVNYQNYIWLQNKFDPMELKGADDVFVEKYLLGLKQIDNAQAVIEGVTPAEVEFTSGMRVTFPNSISYADTYTIYGVGSEIKLIPDKIQVLAAATYSALPWDDTATVTGLILENDKWDTSEWDVVESETTSSDYITMSIDSISENLWSRSNKWYHIDAIEQTLKYNGNEFPTTATRAKRPIIEFNGDIELFNHGTHFYTDITHFYDEVDSLYSDIVGLPISVAQDMATYSDIQEGHTVVFSRDESIVSGIQVKEMVWTIGLDADNNIMLVPNNYDVVRAEPFTVSYGDLLWDADNAFSPNTLWDATDWSSVIVDVIIEQRNYLKTNTNYFVTEDSTMRLPNYSSAKFGDVIRLDMNGKSIAKVKPFDDSQVILNTLNQPVDEITYDYPVEFVFSGTAWYVVESKVIHGQVEPGNNVLVIYGATPTDGGNLGKMYYFGIDNEWKEADNHKVKQNQAPIFAVYDNNNINLDDENTYSNSNAVGSEIFSYKVSNITNAIADGILGFPLIYKSLSQSSDVMFENDLYTNRFTYTNDADLSVSEIPGYYFYRNVSATDNRTDHRFWTTSNGWHQAGNSKQRVVDIHYADTENLNEYQLSVAPLNNEQDNVIVTIAGTETRDFTIFEKSNSTWIRINSPEIEKFQTIETRTYSTDDLSDEATGFYEIPQQLEANPNNTEVSDSAYGDLTPHFTSAIRNQVGFDGNPSGRSSNYRDTPKSLEVGTRILQNNSPMLKAMLVSSDDDISLVNSLRFAQNEYVNFKAKFLSVANQTSEHQLSTGDISRIPILRTWNNNIIQTIANTKEHSESFKYSYVAPNGDPTINSRVEVKEQKHQTIVAVDLNKNIEITNFDVPNISNPDNFLTITHVKTGSVLNSYNDYEVIYENDQITAVFYSATVVEEGDDVQFEVSHKYIELSNATPDISVQENILLVYKAKDAAGDGLYETQDLLMADIDYTIDHIDHTISFAHDSKVEIGDLLILNVYTRPASSFIPSTPAKLGMAPVKEPKLFLDISYVEPKVVIVGHDGSINPTYTTFASGPDGSTLYDDLGNPYPEGLDISGGIRNVEVTELLKYYDKRDLLLLELEKEIYNNILPEFKGDHKLNVEMASIRPGKFRNNDYSVDEYYNGISAGLFSTWCAVNNVNATVNEYFDINNWQTWNYSNAKSVDFIDGVRAVSRDYLPGHWRGIYSYYYDTTSPHLYPWEMLGFGSKPSWWNVAINDGSNDDFIGYGEDYTANNVSMWADIEQGIIRRGLNAGVKSKLHERPGLTGSNTLKDVSPYQTLVSGQVTFRSPWTGFIASDNILPVDGSGSLRTIPELFNIIPNWEGIDSSWKYGDYSPAENAWYSSSEYYFSMCEIAFMTRPLDFTEYNWNTSSTAVINGQIIDTSTGFRSINSKQFVHAEEKGTDGVYIRTGYQQYISDFVASKSASIKVNLGDKIRNLITNLGYKVGGFTNTDTLKMYLETVSTVESSNSLLLPKNNYDVSIYTGAPIKDYVYSGVIISTTAQGTYRINGYDLLSMSFKMLPALPNSSQYRVRQGGQPEEYTIFEYGITYEAGVIVKHNSSFYRANEKHTATAFISSKWSALDTLPENGGLIATYKTDRASEFEYVPYGTEYNSVQDLYDFLIGYGAFLESDGWSYEDIDQFGNMKNWKNAADRFLFWASTDWDEGESILLSPNSDNLTLNVEFGYPNTVERITNGVYNIIDKNGFAIDPKDTTIERDDRKISIFPKEENVGVYGLRINASETEHIIVFDPDTDFNDTIFDPVTRSRQSRLTFAGHRTSGWFGKKEANGYLIQDNKLIQNIDNVVESLRHVYDNNAVLDNTEMEEAARHLIGHEQRDYLDVMGVSDDIQGSFYQGFIRQKGTFNAIDKLLRSSTIKDKELIDFYEDWAFKTANFGNVNQTVKIEVLSAYADVTSDPQSYRLKHTLGRTGHINAVKVLSNDEMYNTVPEIVIDPPTTVGGVQATALVVLTDKRQIDYVEMIEQGSGYEETPQVVITTPPIGDYYSIFAEDGDIVSTDVIYCQLQRQKYPDNKFDNVIDIDVNDADKWLYYPYGVDLNRSIPHTDYICESIPHAGFVNKDEVDYEIFSDLTELTKLYELEDGQTINLAKNNKNSWDVLQSTLTTATEVNGTVDVTNIIDTTGFIKTTSRYNTVKVRLDNTLVSIEVMAREHTGTEIVSGTASWVQIHAVDTNGNKIVDSDTPVDSYKMFNLDGSVLDYAKTYGDSLLETGNSLVFNVMVSLRFKDTAELDDYIDVSNIATGTMVWKDNSISGIGAWESSVIDTADRTNDTIIRKYEVTIDTSLFDSLYLIDISSNETISKLPVIDPIKGILPGLAEQNISYRMSKDPARYTVASDANLVDPSNVFNHTEVGKVWWDTSAVSYRFYELPKSNTETDEEIMSYRRDNWASIFPGSEIKVYEWISSNVSPARYTGDGTTKNTTDYVEERIYNPGTERTEITYFFWVTDKSVFPNNVVNRNTSTSDISNMLKDTKAAAIQWFAPTYKSDTDFTVSVYNADQHLANRNVVLQINFDSSATINNPHTEWKLLREGDTFSDIPDYLWNKMVDSLIGHTDYLSLTDSEISSGRYPNGVINKFPRGIVTGDNALVLPVPSNEISENQKYGVGVRPQQSMFTDIESARRVAINKLNGMLATIQFWNFSSTGLDYTTARYWSEIDWYAEGYDSLNTKAKWQVENTSALDDFTPDSGDFVTVYPDNPDFNIDRYAVYKYENGEYTLVRYERGTIELASEMYSNLHSISVNDEFRNIINTVRKTLFIANNKIMANLLFFTMVQYAFSEQYTIDWAFKTSYITVRQDGKQLQQTSSYVPDLLDEFINYIDEVKPYHTKVRDSSIQITYSSPDDYAIATIADEYIGDCTREQLLNNTCSSGTPLREFAIGLEFARIDSIKTIIDGNHTIEQRWEPDTVLSVTLYNGGIDEINIIDKSAIFAYPPEVTVIGDGTGAEVTISLLNGVINSINVINPGEDYTAMQLRVETAAPTLSGNGDGTISTIENGDESAEELITLEPRENLVINTNTTIVDSLGPNDWDSAVEDGDIYSWDHETTDDMVYGTWDNKSVIYDTVEKETSYKTHARHLDTQRLTNEYYVNADNHFTVLSEEIPETGIMGSIKVNSIAHIQTGTSRNYIWIGNELFSYYGHIASGADFELLDVQRSLRGTSADIQPVGSRVYDASYILELDRNARIEDANNPGVRDESQVTTIVRKMDNQSVVVPITNPWFKMLGCVIHIYGDGEGATAAATLMPDGTIDFITMTNGGTGYTHGVAHIVTSPLINNATATVNIADGVVTDLELTFVGNPTNSDIVLGTNTEQSEILAANEGTWQW